MLSMYSNVKDNKCRHGRLKTILSDFLSRQEAKSLINTFFLVAQANYYFVYKASF